MLEAMGPVELVHVSRTLWIVIAIPMAGALWQFAVARHWTRGASGLPAASRAIDSARVAGLVVVSLTAAAFLAHVVQLRGSVDPEMLLDAVVATSPVGLIDTSLVLELDRLSASFGAVACLVGLAAAARLASRPSPERGWAAWAWLEFALASTLVSLLADGVWTLAIGWAMTIVAGAWLLASDDARASVAVGGRGALALGALLVGGAVVFSSLGSDARPRFEAVRVHSAEASAETESQAQEGGDTPSGTLTLTSPAGAQVLVDDAGTPSLRAPFVRAWVAAGSRVLRIRTGSGTGEFTLAVSFAPGDNVTLVALGPTLSFHAMMDELTLRDARGANASRAALARGWIGAHKCQAAWAAMLACIVGALLMCRVPTAARSPAPLAAFATGVMGPTVSLYLLARMSFLSSLAPGAGLLIAAVGGVALATVVVLACVRPPGALLAGLSSGASSALALLALGTLRPDGAVIAVPLIVLAGSGVALFARRSLSRATAVSRVEDWPFVEASEHFGRFCARMDRWVIGSWVSAVTATARAMAWTVAKGEEAVARHVGEGAANCAVRCARDVEPLVGAPLGRVVWTALGLLAAAMLVHALWLRS
jgi:hypothetical protein